MPALAQGAPSGKPLVEYPEDARGAGAAVLSADGSTVYVLGSWGPGVILDSVTRETVGALPDSGSAGFGADYATRAAGTLFATTASLGYALFDLAAGTVTEIPTDPLPSTGMPPEIETIAAHADGTVTAITYEGVWMRLDGGEVADSAQIREEGSWPYAHRLSSDGSRYFQVTEDPNGPGDLLSVIDMRTGETVMVTPLAAEFAFDPQTFDPSGNSIWGVFYGDGEELWNIGIPSGAVERKLPISDLGNGMLYASTELEHYVTLGGDTLGGDITAGQSGGGRTLMCCSTSIERVPSTGDLVIFDMEMLSVGFITAANIADPRDVAVGALGESAVFTSDSEGLALTEDEEGAGYDAPHGSLWQSSPDGTTWTDMPGETGATLTVVATAESYPLQYRRHFADQFWSASPASAPARMTGLGPTITRADDLPDGVAGTAYGAQEITATGQPDLRWSVEGLPAELTLDPATGTITGTPSTAGEYTFTVTVTDVFGTDAKEFHLTVAEPAQPTPTPTGTGDPTETATPTPNPTETETPSPEPTGGPSPSETPTVPGTPSAGPTDGPGPGTPGDGGEGDLPGTGPEGVLPALTLGALMLALGTALVLRRRRLTAAE